MDTEKKSLSVADWCRRHQLSRPTCYAEINSGRLRTFKVGSRRLITEEADNAWVEAREREAMGVVLHG